MATQLTTSKLSGDKTTLEGRSLAQIVAILAEIFQNQACAVYLFGSRATGTNSPASDFDIAVLGADDISHELSLARERLEESSIPYAVDLVDLGAISPAFARRVQWESRLLWFNRRCGPPIEITICPTCGSDRIQKARREQIRDFDGEVYTVPDLEFYECPNCGERVYDPQAIQKIEACSPSFARRTNVC
jgi:YgiT-type zinc finger domain-containing protein